MSRIISLARVLVLTAFIAAVILISRNSGDIRAYTARLLNTESSQVLGADDKFESELKDNFDSVLYILNYKLQEITLSDIIKFVKRADKISRDAVYVRQQIVKEINKFINY